MQGKLAQIIDDGVTGVAAALIAHDHVIVAGEQIHHAALALVAPVDAYDGAIRHNEKPPGFDLLHIAGPYEPSLKYYIGPDRISKV